MINPSWLLLPALMLLFPAAPLPTDRNGCEVFSPCDCNYYFGTDFQGCGTAPPTYTVNYGSSSHGRCLVVWETCAVDWTCNLSVTVTMNVGSDHSILKIGGGCTNGPAGVTFGPFTKDECNTFTLQGVGECYDVKDCDALNGTLILVSYGCGPCQYPI